MIICGTGHRPDKLGGYGPDAAWRLETVARWFLATLRPDQVISGMALGWDMALARAAVALRVPLVAAVPCGVDVQPSRWPPASRDAYYALLRQAAMVQVVSPGPYRPRAMQERNEYMVDCSALVVALWNGSSGGTANCINYANRRNVPVVNLHNL